MIWAARICEKNSSRENQKYLDEKTAKNIKSENITSEKLFPNILHCADNIGAVQLAITMQIPTIIYTGDKDIFYMQNKNTEILKTHKAYL